MKYLIVLFAFLIVTPFSAFACNSDYDCGYGNKCVKDSRDYSLKGTCVKPTDQFGNRDYNSSYQNWGNKIQPTEVKGCQWNTDCTIGFSCIKKDGSIYGICSK